MENKDDGFKNWLKKQAGQYCESYDAFLKFVIEHQQSLRDALAHGTRRELLEAELKDDLFGCVDLSEFLAADTEEKRLEIWLKVWKHFQNTLPPRN